jgi:cysteine-rich repeat protein
MDLSGGVPDGDGGDLDVSAGLDIVQTGSIVSAGRDQTGVGGVLDLFAERSLTVGPLDASGTCGNCFGGDVNVIAWCRVVVPSGVSLLANGDGGGVLLRSGGDLEVHGNVEAARAIDLLYREATNPPDVSGATFSLTPNVQANPLLTPCGGPSGDDCGNGNVEGTEACDDGNRTSCDGCSSTCQLERCGDGRLGCDEAHRGEACDDGNSASCDGCAGDCTRRDDVCGDGTPECGEECDTAGTIDCDAGACSAQCIVEGCGNGRVECEEQCDESEPTVTCSGECVLLTPPMCGDDVTDAGEGCDDGNTADCDACSRLCEPEGCGNGVVECAEGCDDFNTTPCDGCSATCAAEVCGNQVVDCGEECDEGDDNGKPGSNCLECRIAPICSTETAGACIPCGGALDCDPLGRCAGTDCVDGVCTPDPIDCTSDDPCEIGTCDAALGCVFDPVLGFDSVRCRLTDLEQVLGSDGVSAKAAIVLGTLVTKARAGLTKAEDGLAAGKPRKVGRGLRASQRKVVGFGKRVIALQPKQITDPAVGAALSEKAGDALERIEGLRADVLP